MPTSPTAQFTMIIAAQSGLSLPDIASVVAALAAVIAVLVAAKTAAQARRASGEATDLAERRALALRAAAWSATVDEAVDRHVFGNFDSPIDEPTTTDPRWEDAYGSLDREHRRLTSEASIVLGSNNPVATPMRELLAAAQASERGLQSWRAAEFLRIHQARLDNPTWTEQDIAVEAIFGDERSSARNDHVGKHRVPMMIATVTLGKALAAVAEPDWKPPPRDKQPPNARVRGRWLSRVPGVRRSN